MRFIVYVAAILIAAGTVYLMGRPSGDIQPPQTASSTPEPATSDNDLAGDLSKVALDVPGMHCAFGCYPTVKETLESVEGVTSVELAKQKSENELDDKTVYVTYSNAFSLETALTKLKSAGFDATKIQ